MRTGERRGRLAGLAAPLLLVVACFASTLVEASVPRGAAGAADGASRIVTLAAPSVRDASRLVPDIHEPDFALFAGDELGRAPGQVDGSSRFALGVAPGELDVVGLVIASRVREIGFHPLQGLDLIDAEPLRGPPDSEPKTRIGGLDLSEPFLQREKPRLSLGLQWRCGLDSCEIASGQRFDPLGLATCRVATCPSADPVKDAQARANPDYEQLGDVGEFGIGFLHAVVTNQFGGAGRMSASGRANERGMRLGDAVSIGIGGIEMMGGGALEARFRDDLTMGGAVALSAAPVLVKGGMVMTASGQFHLLMSKSNGGSAGGDSSSSTPSGSSEGTTSGAGSGGPSSEVPQPAPSHQRGGAGPVRLGQQGERAGSVVSGLPKNTRRIPSASGKREYRIPDHMDDSERHILEDKFVKKQHLSSQLLDDKAHVLRNGGAGRVDVIIDRNTQITPQLLREHLDPGSPIKLRSIDMANSH